VFENLSIIAVSLEQRGGIAQLGERLHGMQEVSGSIPLTSTKTGGAQFKMLKEINSRKRVDSKD